MKIGIITFHHAFNYGAFHQTASLVNTLNDMGLDPEVIDYRNPALEEFHERCISPGWNPFSWRASNRQRREKFIQALHDLPLSPRATRSDEIDWSRYHTVIYGSDEIWNHSDHPHGYDPTYFGAGCPERIRKVAYAPSLGELDSEASSPAGIADLLRSFHAISVRDRNAASFVKKITDTHPNVVVDPVLLNIRDDDQKPSAARSGIALVYGEITDPKTATKCGAWAAARGLKTVSFGFRNRWCDMNLLTGGPRQFIECIQSAAFVLTSTFHGTMFAIRHGKPFITIRGGNATKKFSPILESLGLENRVISQSGNLLGISDEFDYAETRARLRILCQQSKDYLVKSLG